MRLILSALVAATLMFIVGIAGFDAGGHRHRPVGAGPGPLPGVTLEAAPDPKAAGAAGTTLVVTSLRSQGLAWRDGVRVGDRLVAIDGWPIAGRAQLLHVLATDPARSILLHLRRGTHMVAVRLDRNADDGTP